MRRTTKPLSRFFLRLSKPFFWPPNPNVPQERLYIRTGAVPEVKADEAREFVENSVIPEFAAWLQAILALAPDSTIRREEQYFERALP